MYHPAAALRTPAVEAASYADVALVPSVLDDARARRAEPGDVVATLPAVASAPAPLAPPTPDQPAPEPPPLDQLTLFR
jgi:hypothetical protein